NFFDVLGIRAAAGRTFVNDDGDGPSVILAQPFFLRRFEGKTSLVGTTLTNGGGNVLVGTLPASFELHFAPTANVPNDIQVFQAWGPGILENKNYIIRLVARLNPGTTRESAQSDLDRVAQEIRDGNAEFTREDLHFTVTGMQADAFRDVRPA